MEDLEKFVDKQNERLSAIKQELKLLETEKKVILAAWKNSSDEEKKLLESQMRESEKSYVRLLDESRKVKKEIEKISKKYC